MKITAHLDPRVRNDGRALVRVIIRHREEKARLPLDIHVRPQEWDPRARRVKTSPANMALATAQNRAIDGILQRAELLRIERPGMTVEEMREALSRPDAGKERLAAALGAVLKDRASRFKASSIDRFGTAVRQIGQALPGATLVSVSAADVHRFREHVASIVVNGRPIHQNSVRKYLRYFRLLYHHACSTNAVEPRPIFKGAIPKEVPTAKRFLRPDEVERLRTVELVGDPRIARDAWILAMCFGGMRFGDLAALESASIRDGWVSYRMGKTADVQEIPIIPQAADIIDHYAGSKYVLPLQYPGANSLVNRRLKIVAAMAGVNLALSTHWARHSFASWADRLKLDRRVIQMILGHKDFKTTQVYMEGFSRERVGEAMEEFSRAMGRTVPAS